MIEKLVEQKLTIAGKEYIYPDITAIVGKFNEIIDTVNKLYEEADNNARIRANHEHALDELQAKDEEIAEWIAIVGDLRKQFRELQETSYSKMEKVEKPADCCDEPTCFISTTYLSDTKTKVFCGQRNCAVEFNQPLPAGFIITIKETKGGDNE